MPTLKRTLQDIHHRLGRQGCAQADVCQDKPSQHFRRGHAGIQQIYRQPRQIAAAEVLVFRWQTHLSMAGIARVRSPLALHGVDGVGPAPRRPQKHVLLYTRKLPGRRGGAIRPSANQKIARSASVSQAHAAISAPARKPAEQIARVHHVTGLIAAITQEGS